MGIGLGVGAVVRMVQIFGVACMLFECVVPYVNRGRAGKYEIEASGFLMYLLDCVGCDTKT